MIELDVDVFTNNGFTKKREVRLRGRTRKNKNDIGYRAKYYERSNWAVV